MSKQAVLVTGAGSGIGLGIAEFFAQRNYQVIVTDRSVESLSQAQQQLAQHDCQFYCLDVTSQSSVNELMQNLERGPDILINNAGIQHVARLEDFPMEQWQRLLEIMLVGVARVTQAFLPTMKTQNFGRIINIGSLHSVVASPYKTAYIAAKHGLLGFAKSLALEVAEHDITINTVCPAYVRTPLVSDQIAQQAAQHGISEQAVVETIMLKPMPKKSFIEVAEIAAACEYFCQPLARNVTAQTLLLDGGWTAQ
ncbi:MAG: 3-hydroxybutyrate dehydrogenase [Gammaproteobacteria bacterium]|nr:3-hydroxybutyrate dehydrogenase [Gammaproteobacteria bacterium]